MSVLILLYFIGFGIYTNYTAELFTINGLDYKIVDENTVSVVGYDYSIKNVVIPKEIEDRKVVEISAGAFEDSKITSIVFQSDIVIGNDVFKNCKYLENIGNGEYVKRVGNNSFENCISLSSVYLPNATHIGNLAFAGCSGVQVFIFPNAVVYSNALKDTEPTEIRLLSTNPSKFVKLFGDIEKAPSSLRKIVIGQSYFPSGYCDGLDTVYQFVTTSDNPIFEEGALNGINSYEIKDGFAVLNGKIVGVDPECTYFDIGYHISDVDGAFNALKTVSNIDTLRLGGSYSSYTAKQLSNISVNNLIIASDCTNVEDGALQRTYANNIIFEKDFDSLRCFGSNYTSATRIEHLGDYVNENEFKPFTNVKEIYIRDYVDYVPVNAFINNISLESLTMPVTDTFNLTALGVTNRLQTLHIIPGYWSYLPSNAINGYYNLTTLAIASSYSEAYDNFISYCSNLETLSLPCTWFDGTPIGEGMYSLRNVELSSNGNFGSYDRVNRSCQYTENLTFNTMGGYLGSDYFAGAYNLRQLTINDDYMNYDYSFLSGIQLEVLDCKNYQSSLANSFTTYDMVDTIIIREGSLMFSSAYGINCSKLVLNMDVKNITFNYSINASEIYLEKLKSTSVVNFESMFANNFYGTIYCPGIACSSLKDLCNKYPNIRYQTGISYFK
jgi:hypothetical protein